MKRCTLLNISIINISIILILIVQIAQAKDIYQHRNLGQAYFEEDRIEEAIAELEECVILAPNSAADHVNLAIGYLAANRYDDAEKALDRAADLDDSLPHIYYNRALIYKRQAQFAKAAEQFEKVKALDPADGDTRYNLALTYLRLKQPEKAAEELTECIRLIPDHVSAHYHLYRYALRTNKKQLAEKELEIFVHLRETIPESRRTDIALERSIYSELIAFQPKDPGETNTATVSVRFADVTEHSGLAANQSNSASGQEMSAEGSMTDYDPRDLLTHSSMGGAAFLDFDNDGYMDIYLVRSSIIREDSTNHLYHNNSDGTFTDVTEEAGVGDAGMGFHCVIGDYDNDSYLDIYVANHGPNILYRNNGDGTFTNVTNQAGVGTPRSSTDAIFVDYDHEGDLDIFVTNDADLMQTSAEKAVDSAGEPAGQQNVLYRNNGDGTFTDVTTSAGVGGGDHRSLKGLFSDFDDDNDIDLCVANADDRSSLYLNLRDGTFAESSAEWHLPFDFEPSVVGDVDNDGDMDIVGVSKLMSGASTEAPTSSDLKPAITVALNQDNRRFDLTRPLPRSPIPEKSPVDSPIRSSVHSSAPYLVDYDNDGRLDLLIVGRQYSLYRNDASSGWVQAPDDTLADLSLSDYHRAAFGDYDNDGDADILLVKAGGQLTLLRNDGGSANHWMKVKAVGVKMNRAGIGSKVEVKAGAFYSKTEIYQPHLLLGLGGHDRLDTVRIKWSNGITQNEIDERANQTLTIIERKGISSSCPFVYAWDGEKYRFVKDILDVGALGVRMDEENYLSPDHDEVIKIDTVKPVARDGAYLFRLTEELQELVYLDQVKLYVVDHPSDISVYHNDGFTPPPFPEFVFHSVKNPIHPVTAYDQDGRDVQPLIAARDRRYAGAKESGSGPYTGITQMHAITLDFGELPETGKTLLLLTGWVNWGDSTDNVAVAQNPNVESVPPYLQVKDQDGRWQTVIDPISIPAGWRKTVAIDLTDIFLSAYHQIRIATNMELYWDEILMATDFRPEALNTTVLLPQIADLRFYGYATPYTPDGKGPLLYDYDNVRLTSPWNESTGLVTRYGDVTPLLSDADDRYVIMTHGDEVHLAFDAKALPSLRRDWVRDFFLYADGWIKDGDLNTAFGSTVEPLPFHGMSGYPYSADEAYPSDAAHLEYQRTYNTRQIGKVERATEPKPTPREILEKADLVRFPEEAFEVDLEMVTITADSKELVRRMKVFSHGPEKVLVEFYYPAREKGRALLMVDDNMWMAIPDLAKTIRVSAHQRLMGSDFSNGDVVRINLARDYTVERAETVVVDGVKAYLLELKAINRKVAYERILYWVRQDNFWPMKLEFYVLSGRLLKTLTYTTFAEAAGRVRPVGLTMESPLNPGQKTLMTLSSMHRTELSDDIFRKSYLERR